MIGIDTNILVRYITQDGKETLTATELLEKKCTKETPGFVCIIVLCELVWVLNRAYKYDKVSIVKIINKLLSTVEFKIENALVAWRALQSYTKGSADYSDYLIGHICNEHNTDTTYTLDKKASKSPNFTLLE
jgi:predicted nucleic-acid-binding protein